MIRVILESPFAGKGDTAEVRAAETAINLAYLRACMRDSIKRGESPFASHGLYTQPGVLDDNDLAERSLGIDAGFAWREAAWKTVVYTDRGLSSGMKYGIAHAISLDESLRKNPNRSPYQAHGHAIEYRTLGEEWSANLPYVGPV